MDVPQKILDVLDFVSTYANDETEWKLVRYQILLQIPSDLRKMFATRDEKLNPVINDFERNLVKLWEDRTGVRLLTADDLRVDSDTV